MPKNTKATAPKKNSFSLNSIRKETQTAEPVDVTLDDGSFVRFPAPATMPAEDADAILEMGERLELGMVRPTAVLKAWLSEEDYARLMAEKLSYDEIGDLVLNVMTHFEDTSGTSGEDDASQN